MKPPLSVILFTLLSGAGLGLCALMILLSLDNNYLPYIQQHLFVLVISGTALMSAGLVSVFFHLANPKNVWRTLAQLKTSWLSREILCSSLFYPALVLYVLKIQYHFFDTISLSYFALPFLFIIFLTLFCTGMMYRCLKTIPQWNTNLVPLNYITLAITSGSLILWIITQLKIPDLTNIINATCLFLFSLALILKVIYFNYINAIKKNQSSIQTATGIKHHLTKSVNSGHSSPNFIDKEFSFKKSNTLIARRVFLTLTFAFIVPLFIISFDLTNPVSLLLITAIAAYGFFLERWLFFVQAHHVVNLYNG